MAGFFRRGSGVNGLVGKVAHRLAAEVREFLRWEALCEMRGIRVYYGVDRLPERDEPISGGLVKCLDLALRYPNTLNKPNLLYLVSSALPDRRDLLVRAAKRAGGRIVLNQNGVAYPAWASVDWQKQNRPNARVHTAADYVVYQSEFCRRCAKQFLGNRSKPGEVLYNPVDTEIFSPRDGFDRSVAAPILLTAGSHHDAYRVKTAIEALGIVRRRGIAARLLVAGRLIWRVEAEAEARQWVHEAGLEPFVEFHGSYSQAEAPALFRKADLLVHLQVQDSCPRLVVEAMSCGVPIVYSATGGVPELVGEEGGVGIAGKEDFEKMHPPSAESAADVILRVLANRATLSRQARARAVRLFSVRNWLDSHQRIFEAMIPRNAK